MKALKATALLAAAAVAGLVYIDIFAKPRYIERER